MIKSKKILIVCTTDSMIWNFLIPHIDFLKTQGCVVECVCSETGAFFHNLESIYGIRMNLIEFRRSPYSIKNIAAFFKLLNLVKRKKYDTIFCHEPVGGAMGRIVGKICNCRVVYMAHGFHFYNGAPKKSIIYYLIEKWLSKYTDVLITINEEDYEAAKRFKSRKVLLTNGVGIDVSKFIRNRNSEYIRNELGLSEKDVILLSVGELIPRKNHMVVIDAVKLLNNPRIHYVVAGEGELKNFLLNRISIDKVDGNVHLLGYRTDINQLCNSADVFLMPSIQEGLSVALMESMACGLPVIASRIRGNVDLIDDKKGGYLVEVNDPSEYASCINRMVDNEDLRIEMGLYNTKKVKDYDIKNVLDQMIQVW